MPAHYRCQSIRAIALGLAVELEPARVRSSADSVDSPFARVTGSAHQSTEAPDNLTARAYVVTSDLRIAAYASGVDATTSIPIRAYR